MNLRIPVLLGTVLTVAATNCVAENITVTTNAGSDAVSVPIDIQPGPNPPWAGWAGTLLRIHLLDATEIDIDRIRFFDGSAVENPFGPRSENTQSAARLYTIWDQNAPLTGAPVTSAQQIPLADIDLHVRNPDPTPDNDIDLSVSAWNIWAIRGDADGTTPYLEASNLYYYPIIVPPPGTSGPPVGGCCFTPPGHTESNRGSGSFGGSGNAAAGWGFSNPGGESETHFGDLVLGGGGGPATGFPFWFHLTTPVSYHLDPNVYGGAYATFGRALSIGVQNIPEPAAGAALVAGLCCFGAYRCCRRRRMVTTGNRIRSSAIVVAALILCGHTSADARADATYSSSLQASLTVAGFLDADGNSISKPAGLTLESDPALTFVIQDSFTEGEATGDADGSLDVVADDPFHLDAGDRFEFEGTVSGTTTYPTGSSGAIAVAIFDLFAENATANSLTIDFGVDYKYSVSTTVDDPELEEAFAAAYFDVTTETQLDAEEEEFLFQLVGLAEYNGSSADTGTSGFAVTLLAGQSELISPFVLVAGDPPAGAVPEPATDVAAVVLALLLGSPPRRFPTACRL